MDYQPKIFLTDRAMPRTADVANRNAYALMCRIPRYPRNPSVRCDDVPFAVLNVEVRQSTKLNCIV